ncbi:hypothetical protein [Fodinicurvata sp. EGI_FJ10296]|uniref:hypothetical protein n=1 Tax=Fodinicurvata sp. EGI_FJ10296 TaxID=3231908 RepID=UPI0034564C63
MPVDHEPVIIEGRKLGDLISIDRKVIFFTTRPECQRFDGRIFADAKAAHDALKNLAAQETEISATG